MDLPASTVAVPDLVRHLEVADGQGTLTFDELTLMNAFWRAANFPSDRSTSTTIRCCASR
jgi:hypothetical protein